jgi:beta-fructofuranosidase
VAPDGALTIEPLPELSVLRGAQLDPQNLHGDSLEIFAEFPRERPAGLSIRRTPDGSEQTNLDFAPGTATLTTDRRRASLNAGTDRDRRTVTLDLPPSEPLRLRVFLDRSLVEIYVNGRTCISTRIYPTRADALGVKVSGEPRVLDAWEMRSAL